MTMHPSLGYPPPDVTAGQPAAAARLRGAARARLGSVAFEAALDRDPTFGDRYDERMLRVMLRDYERHIEQLARALETGEDRFVTQYGEWLVPVYRHRSIPMRDFMTLLEGLASATVSVLPTEDGRHVRALIDRWIARLRHHQRLAGDHTGNPVARFIWKGAGIADDSAI